MQNQENKYGLINIRINTINNSEYTVAHNNHNTEVKI